ncbi:hypothetical protein H072_6334 [Dactylellina haptotyla CBS 200.50]|uniref:Uncharacterized protein n=1 Tax=Dactylellina haptotyla (strain CBS 200.50) TaxID=1284197 RepID=S8AAC6_DACHA|nr:hypothetical protein H072_6334 [Dactylellina haptotyla CBS 200.50]
MDPRYPRAGESPTSASASTSNRRSGDNSRYESVSQQLADILPSLKGYGKTKYPSEYKATCRNGFMEEWLHFNEDAMRNNKKNENFIRKTFSGKETLRGTTIHGIFVDRVDHPHYFMVGAEDGIRGKLVEQLYEPSSNCVKKSHEDGVPGVTAVMARLAFGDPQSVSFQEFVQATPDVVIGLESGDGKEFNCRAVGEVKTPWTCNLGDCSITSDQESHKEKLLGLMAQIIHYMAVGELKYGFFTTYEHVVFVRAMVKAGGEIKFELSRPIGREDTSPSMRQTVVYFLSLLEQGHTQVYPVIDTFLIFVKSETGKSKEVKSGADTASKSATKESSEPSTKKIKWSNQSSSAAGPSEGPSRSYQRAISALGSISESPPASELGSTTMRSSNKKENIPVPGSSKTGKLIERQSDVPVAGTSEKEIQASTAATAAITDTESNIFARSTSEHPPDATQIVAGEGKEKFPETGDSSDWSTPDPCKVYSQFEDRRDVIKAIFKPESTTGLGDRQRVFKGELTWLPSGNVYPVYFKAFKETEFLFWENEVKALDKMSGTGASAEPIIWGYTKGSGDIPRGYVIATSPVEGRTYEAVWWLDPSNKFWWDKLLESLGQFRSKSLIINDPKNWDVFVDQNRQKVMIIDLESCRDVSKPLEISYAYELDSILWPEMSPPAASICYTGPLDPEYVIPTGRH